VCILVMTKVKHVYRGIQQCTLKDCVTMAS